MTPERLRAIRAQVAPHMTQAAFARTLGYEDAAQYRKYETGMRPVPRLLAMLMGMIALHGLPDRFE